MSASPYRHHWQLDPGIVFLNHGSFGAAPTVVLEAQRRFQDELEARPIQFLAPERGLEAKLDEVRESVAKVIGADAQDIGWVRNATDGVNAVMRSFPFESNDEVLITDHGYNACSNAVRFSAERAGATVRVAAVPFPLEDSQQVVDAIVAEFSERTRLLVVDHITSPTGLVLPLEEIIRAAHERGILVMVDGAHAPGQIPVNLEILQADYYTANHHKWLCATKASGFLWVRRELQESVRPTVISHGANKPRPGRSRFLAEFDWVGTWDATTVLSVKPAIEFLEGLMPGGLTALMEANRNLALQARACLLESQGIESPAPVDMIAALSSIPVVGGSSGDEDGDLLKQRLYTEHRIEVPIFSGPSSCPRLMRTSSQAYNDIGQYILLSEALASLLS